MPSRKFMLPTLLANALAVLQLQPLEAQEQQPSAVLESIIVTGTRRAERTVFDSAGPIDVVGAGAINNTVSEDLSDTMAQLVPSFKVQRLPMNDGLIYVRPASLRALSPDHTLVMINGKRRHRSALLGSNGAQAPDLAQIPSYAIERIEVLRDGASAQYGSDAIAGVINIILRQDTGFHAFGQYSEYDEGDGENARIGLAGGIDLGDGSFINATVEYSDAERTSRSRQRPDAIQFQQDHPDVVVPNPVQNWGQPEREALRLMANSEFALSDSSQAYAFASFSDGEGFSDFNWRNPDSTSAFNLTSVFPDFDLRDIYPAGFSPQFGQEDRDLSFTAGVRGELANGLYWDLSAGTGSNKIDYFMFNSINASLGPQSPTAFDIGALEQRELNLNLDFNYEIDSDAMAQPINLAFGLESREETYEISAGEPASYRVGPGAAEGLPSGSNGFPGFSPEQSGESDQNSLSAYLDVELPMSDAFTLGLAGRYEDYSEHDDSIFTGKISARYEFSDNLALRATLSTGFRAPTPGQLFSERTSQGLDTVTLNIFTAGRFSPEGPVASIVSQRPGVTIDPLEAEESDNISAGIVYRNDAGFTSSLDIYRIEVENRFGTSSSYTLTDSERQQLIALGVPGGEGITRVNFYQNDFDTRSRGVDLVMGYGFEVGSGQMNLSASMNYNKTEVTGGSLASNDTSRIRFEKNLPRHSYNFGADYLIGDWEIQGRVRYYGKWTDFSFNAAGDIHQDFGAEAFTDLSVSYNFNDALKMRLGAENLFDQYPEEAEFQANRGLIYSRNAPYDTDGRRMYLRLDWQL